MVSYRFCRTDDVALLVRALNECYFVHFPDAPRTSVADFKRDVREMNLWCSSCMVAVEDGEPVAVVTGAKRKNETLIHRVGVRPDFIRRGHARHLLTSMSQKLSVLGPPRIVAEIPEDLPATSALFEACGYQRRGGLTDYSLATSTANRKLAPVAPDIGDLASPITLDEVLEQGAFNRAISRSWERTLEALEPRRDGLEGLAIASEKEIEAYVFYRDSDAPAQRKILALAHADTAQGAALLEILLSGLDASTSMHLVLPKIAPEEVSPPLLARAGFRKQREYRVWERSVAEVYLGCHLG